MRSSEQTSGFIDGSCQFTCERILPLLCSVVTGDDRLRDVPGRARPLGPQINRNRRQPRRCRQASPRRIRECECDAGQHRTWVDVRVPRFQIGSSAAPNRGFPTWKPHLPIGPRASRSWCSTPMEPSPAPRSCCARTFTTVRRASRRASLMCFELRLATTSASTLPGYEVQLATVNQTRDR